MVCGLRGILNSPQTRVRAKTGAGKDERIQRGARGRRYQRRGSHSLAIVFGVDTRDGQKIDRFGDFLLDVDVMMLRYADSNVVRQTGRNQQHYVTETWQLPRACCDEDRITSARVSRFLLCLGRIMTVAARLSHPCFFRDKSSLFLGAVFLRYTQVVSW